MDDEFVRAVEARYPEELERRSGAGLTLLAAHRAAVSAAVTKADPERGRDRYRALGPVGRADLEERLLRACA
jgi:hypothetical protein